jgi:hypothetical protein
VAAASCVHPEEASKRPGGLNDFQKGQILPDFNQKYALEASTFAPIQLSSPESLSIDLRM